MNLKDVVVSVDSDLCIGCGSCVKDCPSEVLVMSDNKAILTSSTCLKCAHCYAVCPTEAIGFSGTQDTVIKMEQGATLNPDALYKHLKLRRSIRHFKTDVPSKDVIEQIIEAGRLTPTASNKQNVRYIVINEGITHLEDLGIQEYVNMQDLAKAGKMRIPASLESATFERGFLFQGAPCLILAISQHEQNASLATMSMELMLESLGLGCVYVGLFTRPANSSEAIRSYLKLSEKEQIVSCLALGYPDVYYHRSAPKLPADITWNIS